VSEEAFQVASIDELGIQTVPGRATWSLIRTHFDVGAFGINAWTGHEPGVQVINEHDELGGGSGRHEELYVVVDGRATFTVNGQEVDAPAGTLVFVRDPAARRGAVAAEPETTVLAIGGPRGEAFEPSPWELSAPALVHWGTGEFDKAIEQLSRTLEQNPDNTGVLYNLACAEARNGDRDSALEHLRRAIELQPRSAESAARDEDFESLRADPAFKELIGEAA
jgi:tetratricopeptide (TPR) repeat protein